MKLILTFVVFVSCTKSSLAGTSPADRLCSYGGNQYAQADLIPHPNECAELQCQFGQVIAYWEACGKEIDGECHAADSSYIFEDITYECRKTVINGSASYRNVRITPVTKDCQAEGALYKHLDKFRLSDTCNLYQCQDGDVVVIEPACGKELDGNCHDLNLWFNYNEQYYNCIKTTDENGQKVFETQLMDPQPDPNIRCNYGGSQYVLLDTILAGCNMKQCQNGYMIDYLRKCKFWRDEGKCYREDEQWIFQKGLWDCEPTVSNGQTSVQPHNYDVSYFGCWLGETQLKHLETTVTDKGCSLRQCVNGTVPYLRNTCQKDGVCYTVDSIWITDGVTYKCIFTSYGYRKIVRVDEDGTFDEGQKPQPPEIGEIPPYEGCPAVADIILVFDSSRSLSKAKFDQEIAFATNITDYFKIGPNDVRFGDVVFSDDAQKVFDLKDHENHDSVKQALVATPYLQGLTRTDLALNLILDQGMLDTAAGGRDEADDIVIILTDGNSDNPELTLAAADRLKAQNVDIITIGIGYINPEELINMATRFENAFLAPSFEVLSTLLNEVSSRACDTADKCKDDPCDHFCDGTETGFTCRCREGFEVDPSDLTKCLDINECANEVNSPCQQRCINTEGSYKCDCDEGYMVNLMDTSKCIDVNECTSGVSSPCQQVCNNKAGSFECSCEEGYTVDPNDETKCVDIDECADWRNLKCQYECRDTEKGFICSCPNGYELDLKVYWKCIG